MQEAVIVSAVRTPVGRYMGALRDVEAYELGAKVLNSSLEQAGLSSDQVDAVIMGQTYQNGEYVNIGRMSLLKAGWPESIPATTKKQEEIE
jgi:acetyl-CoA C-acetyltransferase